MQATSGARLVVPSSWKLDSSAATQESASRSWSSLLRAKPMFPATVVFTGRVASISPKRVVVVVFPLLPVTAHQWPLYSRLASSASAMISIFRSRAFFTVSVVKGIPGEIMNRWHCSR